MARSNLFSSAELRQFSDAPGRAPRVAVWFSGLPLLLLCAVPAFAVSPPVEPGLALLASAEGLSVFSREGGMHFGHFVTSLEGGGPGEVAWDDMVYDGWRLPSGNYLCSSHRYVRELSPDGATVWEFRIEAPSELKTCVPLPNGDVMTVDAERMELVQITDLGRREAKRIPAPTNKDAAPHVRYNLLRRTPQGTYLLALRDEKAFVEIDETGRELWRHPVPDLPVVAERLGDGNTLMSWSGGLIEAAPDHRVVWEAKAEDFPDFSVIIFGGFHRFPNGNTLIANSDWHYKTPGQNQVQLFEVTRDKRVVWKLTTDAFRGHKPGSLEPSTGLVEHRIIGLQWLGDAVPAARSAPVDDTARAEWETLYRERLKWWSLQRVARPAAPPVKDTAWPRNDVDHFILARLEAEGLKPAAEAERRTLARRLSFALTGLPPAPEDVERFAASSSPSAYEALVEDLLASSHFGEHWARHWMDVVHYTDTHGYEWDVPAKNAWMYRDYLVRAFNQDVPFRQLVLEQLAGDLIAPRVDPDSGLNEALIGPMALRLGERRHGDNSDAEGITQEAMANVIDTVSKGFMATTVACAQCHDHKLDAVSQRDYYGLAGMLMSSRWHVRPVDAADPNAPVIEALGKIKREIREEVAERWRSADDFVRTQILATPREEKKPADNKAAEKAKPTFPETLRALWLRVDDAVAEGATVDAAWTALAAEFHAERTQRITDNAANLQLVADFTQPELPAGWRVEGRGMKYGLVAKDGELVVAEEDGAAIARLLPAGRWTNVWSSRLAGAVRGPLFAQDPAPVVSAGYAAGQFAAESTIVDNAFHSERMKFLDRPLHGWLTLKTGRLPALTNDIDPLPRRVYFEMVTKSLNNYFPPRHAFGGVKPEDELDPRSWFGLTRIYQHPEGKAPADELARFAPLFTGAVPPASREELAARMTAVVMAAVEHWRLETCDSEDVTLLNDALIAKWLPNDTASSPGLAGAVARYREIEATLVPDRVIGSLDDWREGVNQRIGLRGSYTEFGDEVPRGNIGFLGGAAPRAEEASSGRLEFAQNIASDGNPLTARVFVNRVWYHLFGAGIVRTVDDFGHLGELPSHPELLDWLAARFMDDGWSLKKLVRLLVTSAAWRQGSIEDAAARTIDPENRLWHHWPMRRLEAESIRDALLVTAGRLDPALYGPPVDPYRTAQDPVKRLLCGPLDGDGRRSLYLKMTLMEPPKFLALFNQPLPKLTTGRRDATNVPDQALALLNDPFVIAMAKLWGEGVLLDGAATPEDRAARMFAQAFGRPPAQEEVSRLTALAQRSAELRGTGDAPLLGCGPVWQDVAHAIFNLKEFIYVQ